MAMHYYFERLPQGTKALTCNGCGATMAFYKTPAPLFYGL